MTPEQTPSKGGRKPYEPSEADRTKVRLLAGYGLKREDICVFIVNPVTTDPIDPKTLRKYYEHELDYGLVEMKVAAAQNLSRMVRGAPAEFDERNNKIRDEVAPTLGAIIWWEKTRGGVSEYNPAPARAAKDQKVGKKVAAAEIAQTAEENTTWAGLIKH